MECPWKSYFQRGTQQNVSCLTQIWADIALDGPDMHIVMSLFYTGGSNIFRSLELNKRCIPPNFVIKKQKQTNTSPIWIVTYPPIEG